jgi:hypothetical protein
MATISHFEGIDYTLTMKKLMSSQGYDRSTVEAKDLTGRVFETWHRRYRLWRHPIHGTARSIAEIKEIYNAIDVDDYVNKNGYED